MEIPLAFDTSRSLAELEGEDWTFDVEAFDAPPHAHGLATKPVRRLTCGELLQLLQWNVSPRFTIPAAMARLADDPFVKAGSHEGDLMVALLESDPPYWKDHHDMWCAMVDLLANAVTEVAARVEADEAGDYLPQFLGDDFMAAVMHFREYHG